MRRDGVGRENARAQSTATRAREHQVFTIVATGASENKRLLDQKTRCLQHVKNNDFKSFATKMGTASKHNECFKGSGHFPKTL